MGEILPTCRVCACTLIPGGRACVNCGEPHERVPLPYEAWNAGYALEQSGDLEAACRFYEAHVEAGNRFPQPYRRLALLYRKLKRPADEERVVRLAVVRMNHYVNAWFIRRMAVIQARKR